MQQKRCSRTVTEVQSGKRGNSCWARLLGIHKQGFSEMMESPTKPHQRA
jgi:hypothetical protein